MTKTQDMVRRAERFAVKAHGDQKYGNEFPYKLHLLFVVKTLKEFGFTEDFLLAGGWLHDTLEDTAATYEELVTFFGEEVADLVAALTEPKGGNRKWRHQQTYPRTAGDLYAIIVKVADRIANVEVGGDKVSMYRKEHSYFKTTLQSKYDRFPPVIYKKYLDRLQVMWDHLDGLLIEVDAPNDA